MTEDTLVALVESSDFAGLLRYVENSVAAGDWERLVTVRDRCDEAVTRGKQVWSIAQYAEYRLALDAPGRYAGRVVKEGAGRSTLGPLWEVAASTHTWNELAPYLDAGRARSFVAAERMLRGDEIPETIELQGLDVPLILQPWEPDYPVADYRSDGVVMPEDDAVEMEWTSLPEPGVPHADQGGSQGLMSVIEHWVDESTGRAETSTVEGDAYSAIRALGPSEVRLARVDLARALSLMTWAGASGGAQGRRRGTPVGRASAWWALACLLGLDEEWPVDPHHLGQEAQSLRWVEWDPGERVGGWSFYLAVEDSLDGLAWAVSALDWK